MKKFTKGSVLLLQLDSRLDANNAADTERQIMQEIEQNRPKYVIIDAVSLEYISSVGLRILLRIKKEVDATQIVNVSTEVFDILSMTGFTEIMDVKKAFRQVNIEDCRILCRGEFDITYKLNSDQIVKVFNEGISYEEMIREREYAKAAFISGVPTAIPFDTVKVGTRYGNVYELTNSRPLSETICGDPYNIDIYAEKAVDLLKLLSDTHAQPGRFHRFVDRMLEEIEIIDRYIAGEKLFTPEEKELVIRLYNTVPERDTLIHGAFHTHNIFEQNGELLLMNMANTSTGHQIFEIGNMYLAFVIISEKADEQTKQLIGLDNSRAIYFFNKMLQIYFSDFTSEDMQSLRSIAEVLGHLRMMTTVVTTSSMDNLSQELKRKYLFSMKGVLKSIFFDNSEKIIGDTAKLSEKF